MIVKSYNNSIYILLFYFLVSFFFFSCENTLIENIVGSKIVNFESNGGSGIESQTVLRGQRVKKPSDPLRGDYIFDAWYRDNETFLEEWDFAAAPNDNITLYAKWIAKELIPITDVAITITQPETGAAPSTTASGGSAGNFTAGAVSWSPNDNPFHEGVMYTAAVTLTARQDYAFASELHTVTINGQAATVVSHTANALAVSYTFPPTRTVTGMTITGQPKLAYTHGDTLDLSELAVTFSYNDSTTETVAFNHFASRNILTSLAHGTALVHLTHNGAIITVSKGSFTDTTAAVTVDPKAITFAVDPIPAREYTGSAHEPELAVRDGEEILTLNVDYTVAYTDNTAVGTAVVTINGAGNYAGSTGSATFAITKIAVTTAAITVTGPSKNDVPNSAASGMGNFTVGAVSWSPAHDPFQGSTVYTASLMLTADQNYTFAGNIAATINGQPAVVTANTGETATLSYTFAATDALAVTGISVKTLPATLTYTHGEALNLTGLAVTLDYEDGSGVDFTFDEFASKNISINYAHDTALVHLTHNGEHLAITYGSFAPQDAGTLIVNPKIITFAVDSILARTYTGSAIEPELAVRDGTTALALSADYTVVYSANTNAGTAAVAISGAGNYAGSTGSANFTINKANPTVSWPTGLTATYGDTLAAISLASYNNGGTGSFAWTTPSTPVGNAGTRSHSMIFTPTDGTNYNNLTKTDVAVEVAKAAGAAITTPLNADSVGANSVTLNAISSPLANGQTVEYGWSVTYGTPPATWQGNVTFTGLAGGTTYYFYARSAANDNYEAGTGYSSVQIITLQNQTIAVTLDVSELVEKGPNFDSNITISRSGAGANQSANVTVTGVFNSISWKIPGVGAHSAQSVSGTTALIQLDAENEIYNSPGWHTVTITVTVGAMEYMTSFRFRIVD